MRKKNRFLLLFLLAVIFTVTFAFTAGTASALLKVNVMPSGVASRINVWDNNPYTWPGNNLELWGNVQYDGAGTLTYTWNFGGSEGSTSGTVSNRSNIAANHVYNSTGNFIATLTVTDGTQSDSDTVYIDVVPQTLEIRKNLAIERALKYLYMNQRVWSINGCDTRYWNGDRWTAATALAVLAFEDYGHRESNDPNKDIYAETVKKGLQSVFAMLRATGAANTPPGDSDINGNGQKIYEGYTGGNMYEQGILAMAIANTGTPGAIAACGYNSNITGKAYKTLLEDMVDYIAYGQNDSYSWREGGWRYGANYGDSDNSVSQWPALGLAAAENAKDLTLTSWGIAMPAWVKTRMQTWINYSQCSNGGFGYTYACYWGNIAKTGAGIIQMVYAGGGGNKANALSFIDSQWSCCSNYSDYGNLGDHYAMYAVKKGMQYADLITVGSHDWQNEYNTWYVNNQVNAGTNGVYWNGSVRISGGESAAMFGLLVMAPGLVEIPPVANAGNDQEVIENQDVSFDGSNSYHPDTNKSIVTYEWDFDYDGVTFDVDATGEQVTKAGGYAITNGTDMQLYTAALRVTDEAGLIGQDTAIITVTNGNVAPVANAGGPYLAAVGEVIALNGTGSYDNNSAGGSNPLCGRPTPSGCDEIVSYEWDFDGDGQYDDATGATPTISFPTIGTRTIGLKVTDSFGRSAAQSSSVTTVAVSDLWPVSYQLVSNIYNRITNRHTVKWKVNINNRGNAAATVVSATLTPVNIPAGCTVNDDTVSWSGSIDPGETQLSGDDFTYTYPRGGTGPDLRKMTWDIYFTDALGQRQVIRNVPQ